MHDPGGTPVILWFRKDLRFDDNRALAHAAATGRPVLPLYIREPNNGPLGAAQSWWLHHSLVALGHALERLGSRLLLRSGAPQAILSDLIAETGATEVLWNRRYDPAGIESDTDLKSTLRSDGVAVHSFSGQLLHEPSRMKTGTGGFYRVYTPFWRAFEASGEPEDPIEARSTLPAPAEWPDTETLDDWHLLPAKPDWAAAFREVWAPGEAGARKRLEAFVRTGLAGYAVGRDFPAEPHVSMLSPHLALGEISPARVWHATRGLSGSVPAEDVTSFRKELVWREFGYHLLFHFPALARRNFSEKFDGFPWRNDPEGLRRWQRGETGYPIIDAGMRQLWQMGWMHNRVRMIVASFLVKDLLIDWREGERWFRDTLVDADPASNAASWQWVAGSGADAAPFFRIFNPVSQGEKFDPDGAYVRRFVPELKALPDRFIHRPFDAPLSVLEDAGVSLGKTYPLPIVDHKAARERALAAFRGLAGPSAG
ncbi:deoxyribodipyrimidine photo-lyase type I [Ciceribacter lividus]|uniref:Deoxyribodipyrimidine photo-lyase n=1 Tax=Ciceribacter lividus TaxID=1197950 RepID=A0A6I7HMM3_9HYPH|nr:deoxyribodipyrimidine photo-lyase [Ciceribacter lividus]RCW24707.1 deoxyribodipyrimidine photo-lyase type I [Ciceribacter lividus]